MSNWLRMIGAFLVLLVCVLFIAKGFLPPADPKFVSAINYEQLQTLNQGPCIVYFYHKSTDTSVRKMMPALDELASRFQDKIGFYRCQFSNPEKKLPQKTDYESCSIRMARICSYCSWAKTRSSTQALLQRFIA